MLKRAFFQKNFLKGKQELLCLLPLNISGSWRDLVLSGYMLTNLQLRYLCIKYINKYIRFAIRNVCKARTIILKTCLLVRKSSSICFINTNILSGKRVHFWDYWKRLINTIDKICLSGLRFERCFSHHRAT